MPSNNIIRHHSLVVELNGRVSEKRAVRFTLLTQKGSPSVIAMLYFPAGAKDGKKGETIKVYLADTEKRDLYFTGTVHNATEIDSYRKLFLTDGFSKLCSTPFTAAYRKEKASVIIDDILEAANINEKSVTVPDIELARFSTQPLQANRVLDMLIDALKEHGAKGLCYFFDEKDRFHFGTEKDTGKNAGEAFQFDSKQTIFSRGADRIETLPAPIRHSMTVTVDGASMETIRTELTVTEKASRLILHIKG